MKARSCFSWAIVLVLVGGFSHPVAAQVTGQAPAILLPPAPPPIKSPVEVFRELLAMAPDQRELSLTNRSPDLRKLILAKVHEYEALSPNQREFRLHATELRWYLWPLMNTAPTNRAVELARIPGEFRSLVGDRLEEWDKLPAAAQKDIRDNEATIRSFMEIEGSSEAQKTRILESLNPAQRRQLEEGLAQWRSLPEEKREKALERFNRFFGLTDQEKLRALNTLSEPERQRIEQTLQAYARLPVPQRVQCIRALGKFAGMSVEERKQFLQNAERWKTMTPDQREAWSRLVSKLSVRPPVPPGLGSPALPPSPISPASSRPVVTNGN